MGKWIAGIIGAVIIGTIMWILTNKFFPVWFVAPPAMTESKYRVDCTLNPATVAPGQTTEVIVKVTRDDEPLEGAELEIGAGGGSFGTGGAMTSGNTYSGGLFRTIWTPPPGARGLAYVFSVVVKGIDSTELALKYNQLGAHTQCHLIVGN